MIVNDIGNWFTLLFCAKISMLAW